MMDASTPSEENIRVPLWLSRDVWIGLVLIAISGIAIWQISHITAETESAFGPATAPLLFAYILLILALGVLINGIVRRNTAAPHYSFRGPLFITIAGIAFAAAIQPLGLAISTFLTFVIAGFASPETRFIESIVIGILTSVLCCALFAYALHLPVNIFPSF